VGPPREARGGLYCVRPHPLPAGSSRHPNIESVLTVVGGRIVDAAGEYEGLDEDTPEISPSWSTVARFGGYEATAKARISGLRQAELPDRPSPSPNNTGNGECNAA
jgi:hypothetical protein